MNYFADLDQNIELAIHEDVGSADLTADLIQHNTQATAKVICRESAVICGLPWFEGVFNKIDPSIQIDWQVKDGDQVEADQLLCTIQGKAKHILTAERAALNFLQTLSATATATASYTAVLAPYSTQLLDTRKTLPGLRLAQKYAVHCGGGTNHRIGLYDAILIKENHIMAAGSILNAVSQAKQQHPTVNVEVETENLDEVQQALEANADIIMLDNFSIEMIEQAVKMTNKQAKLEVSGNVTIEQLPAYGQTGVDFISTGAITKHIQAVDLSMRFEMQP